MAFVILGLNHRSAAVAIRERFAYADTAIRPALDRLRQTGLVTEMALLSTCNRTELYAAGEGDTPHLCGALRHFLLADREVSSETLLGPGSTDFYHHADAAAAEHLFRVASGLDSLVLGETEILGQLKQAYERALRGGFTGKILNKTFQRAFSVAKQVRTETNIQRGNTSIASVAVELAERIFDRLEHREVLVIGAGDTSEKTARALLSRGARSVLVSNRTYDRAVALAQELGGRALPFDQWETEFARVDIVISATGAPHFILTRARLEHLHRRRGSRPLLLIDLAVPRDIDPDCEQLDDVFVYNVDHLQGVADEASRLRKDEIAVCEKIIRAKAHDLIRSVANFGNGFQAATYSDSRSR